MFTGHIEKGQTLSFALRYLIYMFAWIIPVYLIAVYVVDVRSFMGLFFFTGTSSIAASGFQGLILAIIGLTVIFAPSICCILAAECDSFEELFSTAPLEWLFLERRQDLGPYYSSVFGGLFIFYTKYLIPLVLINILLFKTSFETGMAFSSFTYLLPFLISPILIGRLSGAFVAGEAEMASTAPNTLNPELIPPSSINQESAPVSAAKSTEELAKLKQMYKQCMENIETTEGAELRDKLQTAQAADPDNVFVQLTRSHLYLKIGQINEAIQNARLAMSNCLQNGMSYEALGLYKAFSKHKSKLNLNHTDLLLLAGCLSKNQMYMDAAWCYLLSIATQDNEEEKLNVQKKYLELADKADRSNHMEIAHNLYLLFMKQYPDSTLIEFAKEQAQNLEMKLAKK